MTKKTWYWFESVFNSNLSFNIELRKVNKINKNGPTLKNLWFVYKQDLPVTEIKYWNN